MTNLWSLYFTFYGHVCLKTVAIVQLYFKNENENENCLDKTAPKRPLATKGVYVRTGEQDPILSLNKNQRS